MFNREAGSNAFWMAVWRHRSWRTEMDHRAGPDPAERWQRPQAVGFGDFPGV